MNMATDPNLEFLNAILYLEREQVENDFGCQYNVGSNRG
jgi:hypothetical protein